MADERLEDNLNPAGRVSAGASVLVCTPHALAEGGAALGTLATEAALREVVNAGGLSRSSERLRRRSTVCSRRDSNRQHAA